MSLKQELKTPIAHEFNLSHGAKFADFNSWQMPTFYSSIKEEYFAVRESIGLFDVSHMGRWWVTGKQAQKYLDNLITNSLEKLKEGRALYTPMCNEEAGIIDDLIIYKYNSEKFFVVNNAGNHSIDSDWYKKHLTNEVQIQDVTNSIGQIAVQGPKAQEAVNKILSLEESLKYFSFIEKSEMIITATGYTGEKGYELYASSETLMQIWEKLISDFGAKPCGLGSRDLLRLEAGYCLHGNDISLKTTPYEAGLQWTVKLDKESFIGKENVTKQNKKLVGLKCAEGERVIPRSHTKVYDKNDKEIGEVTSGNFSIKLNSGIALAYLTECTDQEVFIEIRSKKIPVQVQEAFFYRNI